MKDIPYRDELILKDEPFCYSKIKAKSESIGTSRFSNKIVGSLKEVVELCGLKSGMTISFHHHFRNGDYIVNTVMDVLAQMGLRDMVVAASSLTTCHAPLIEHIKNGVIRRIETSGMRGPLAEAVSRGLCEVPVTFRSHGGRANVIETRQMPIDVAFLGAPSCDPYGNANGYSRDGSDSILCGSMGYAKCDAQYAAKTVIITNNIVFYPNTPFGIPQSDVDYVVKIDKIGDSAGIMSGATRYTTNPKELLMAEMTSKVIENSGRFVSGFSFQLGSGGASLAVARFLRRSMDEKNIKASFALGGITGAVVELHETGLVKKLLDVQSFDLKAAQSLRDNRFHQQISASYYASPNHKGAAVNQLDVVVLSALEVDTSFNVNVLTGSDGVIRGAIGGHQDTAYGSKICIVVMPLVRSRIPCVVGKIETVVTPGNTVDVLVTDHGIAVNPIRGDLRKQLIDSGLTVVDIEKLEKKAHDMVGSSCANGYEDKVVGVVTYRDGTVIDMVHQIAD